MTQVSHKYAILGEKLAPIVANPRSPRDKAGERINRQAMLDEKMKKFLAVFFSFKFSKKASKSMDQCHEITPYVDYRR